MPSLKGIGSFTLQQALESAGWPPDVSLDISISKAIEDATVSSGIFESVDSHRFRLGCRAEEYAMKSHKAFEHLKARFKQALSIRIKRKYPAIPENDALQISSDIEASLIGYFREGGLSLSTTLFCGSGCGVKKSPVPSSILRFITEASAMYDDALKRQAFCTISVDTFVRSENAEREYLGRIAQGFFAFHSLGVYGDVASERLSHAKDTVWLVDSNVQIGLLSISSLSNAVFYETFSKLRKIGVRLFTTEKLFDEVYSHFYFANKLIEKEGADSASVLAAASGDIPYNRSNAFLEGFINWQVAGNPCEWKTYLFDIFGKRTPTKENIISTLEKFGIEMLRFMDWPGFRDTDYVERDDYAKRIVQRVLDWTSDRDIDDPRDPYKKADPEAEAMIIIKKERNGKYSIISDQGIASAAWFISDTSILNAIDIGETVTWQPEAFARFVFTIAPSIERDSADRAFESILLSIARSGLSILSDEAVSTVFGGIIDQTHVNIVEQRQLYEESLGSKYGESPEKVIERVALRFRPIAGIQLAEERAQAETARRKTAEKVTEDNVRLTKSLKDEVRKLSKLKKKLEDRKARAKRKKRKSKSKKSRRKVNKG